MSGLIIGFVIGAVAMWAFLVLMFILTFGGVRW